MSSFPMQFPDSRPDSYKKKWSSMTRPEIVKESGLDWPVQKRQLAMRDSLGKNVLVEPLKDFRAIVRADTDRVFKVGSARFKIHQNPEILDLMLDFCDKGQAELANVITFDNGAVIAVQAKLKADLVIPGGSKLEGYAMIAWSHNSSIATCFKGCATYVICWNTLIAAIREKSKSSMKVRHSQALSPKIIERARGILDSLTEDVSLVNERMQKFSTVKMDEQDRIKFILRVLGSDNQSMVEVLADEAETSLLDKIVIATDVPPEDELRKLGKRIVDSIIESPGSQMEASKDTLFGVLNGFTYYADHVRGRDPQNRAFNAFFGEGEKLKAKAMETALEITGWN